MGASSDGIFKRAIVAFCRSALFRPVHAISGADQWRISCHVQICLFLWQVRLFSGTVPYRLPTLPKDAYPLSFALALQPAWLLPSGCLCVFVFCGLVVIASLSVFFFAWVAAITCTFSCSRAARVRFNSLYPPSKPPRAFDTDNNAALQKHSGVFFFVIPQTFLPRPITAAWREAPYSKQTEDVPWPCVVNSMSAAG
jgi:hypothetical protein